MLAEISYKYPYPKPTLSIPSISFSHRFCSLLLQAIVFRAQPPSFLIQSSYLMTDLEKYLGLFDQPYTMSSDVIRQSPRRSANVLIVRRLHIDQDIKGLLEGFSDVWQLDGRGSATIVDKDTIKFVFQEEHHLNYVRDGAPWSFGGWFVAMDLFSNVKTPKYLSVIPMWAKISNIPDNFQNTPALMEIGKLLGQPTRTLFSGFENPGKGECRVRVDMKVTDCLKFTLRVNFTMASHPTTDLSVSYDNLSNFCKLCGSILHQTISCVFPTGLLAPITPTISDQKQNGSSNSTNKMLNQNPAKRFKQIKIPDADVCSELNFFTVQQSQKNRSHAGVPEWRRADMKGKSADVGSSLSIGSFYSASMLSHLPKQNPPLSSGGRTAKGKSADVGSSLSIGSFYSSSMLSHLPKQNPPLSSGGRTAKDPLLALRHNEARSNVSAADTGFILKDSPADTSEPVIIHLDEDGDTVRSRKATAMYL